MPGVVEHRSYAVRTGRLVLERLGQQVGQVQHLDAVVAEGLRERVMLVLGASHPWDAVEEQLVVVAGGQPLELRSRAVQQHRAEPPDLGVGARVGTGRCIGHPPRLRGLLGQQWVLRLGRDVGSRA